jgi:NTE family protein
MANWDPGRVRQAFGLTLSEEQKRAIHAKLPASPEAGVYFADGVFEGGGVLGIAFLGAARCCSDLGIRWKGLAGTSAGAITASLLASGLTIDRLEQILGGLDFNQFLSQKTSILVRNGDPSDDLDDPVYMVGNLKLIGQLGEYSTEPFKTWIDGALGEGGMRTFGDVGQHDPERALKVVVSDISHGAMRVLPDDLPGDPKAFSVAEAVRLSMSIPFFFVPGRLGESVIVDGGILSNFPLWIYDEPDPRKPPAWPTFGFRLVDRREQRVAAVRSVTDILGAMFKTMMYAGDRHYLSQRNEGRVIDLDVTEAGVTATQFNLGDGQKDRLYRIGYEGTRDFFLNRWDWKEHLRVRGFPQP